jgi:translocation and assembly module TamB
MVSGEVILGPMEIQIPEQSEVSFTNVRVNNPEVLPKQKWQRNKKQTEVEDTIVKLDIKVSAPSQVFVRGRGLDTEMRGNLHITGTSGTPHINGQLRTMRGIFNFLDRELAIVEGIMDFRGRIPPSPYLNIEASATTNEITAGIRLTGPVNMPTLKLTSTPNLPEDEILAHLLFGRELRGITPMQGAQLLQALNSLRGGGQGFDPVGDIRKAIGVDRLNIDANETGDVTVGTGKYITDKIYLGVEGGAGENSGKIKAEIEATRSITIEAESGANSNGTRINWKHDY